ncbi:hypothetical protein SmJEL517_g00239 [Synchytrium microbalum]|uniref:ABC transporter domain-containing protein n=1 Tax=Synchytrium microbalum TaxID=1806994 RepID=A0A507CJK2_9FUNG|nr:uncharacterized protein SmJEL517_g00239 [Synchytrium microbalum]TPX37995.1 hypothetical protein SmJEL517_g00239 [Synchytrium microbalum]
MADTGSRPPSYDRDGVPDTKIHIEAKSADHIAKGTEVQIVFQDLSYSIVVPAPVQTSKGPFAKKEMVTKQILKNVNGAFNPGRLTAVMGASGAGKTSLLQVLAGEAKQGMVEGRILLNGEEIVSKEIKRCSGFVFQDDVILSTMTVREAITMSALLRLPSDWTLERKHAKVDETIQLLGLEKAANTIIGDTETKGVSGGERKRTAMAMEMITEPQVLFLDEPTSGLDTFTAYAVIKILSELAHAGRTIIATIHQPSSEIFHLFDDLVLMADGKVMYAGSQEHVVDYFGAHGYPCPKYSNPADYLFMSVLNNTAQEVTSGGQVKENNKDRIERLLGVFDKSDEFSLIKKQVDNPDKGGVLVGSTKKFPYLLQRASKNAIRNPLIIKARMAQTVVISLIIGFLFLNTGSTTGQASVQNRSGVLFFASVNNVMSSCIGILSIFGGEKTVFTREHGAQYYSLPSYFISKTLVEMPYQILFPWGQATILYWMVGLQNVASKYFIFSSFVVLSSVCGWALGIFFACMFSSLPVALAVTPVILMPLMLFSGLFANLNAIPIWLRWIQYISPIKYGFEGMLKNEYTGIQLWCAGALPVDGSVCLTQQGMDDGLGIWACALILIAMVLALLGLAYLSLNSLVSAKSSSTASYKKKKCTPFGKQSSESKLGSPKKSEAL